EPVRRADAAHPHPRPGPWRSHRRARQLAVDLLYQRAGEPGCRRRRSAVPPQGQAGCRRPQVGPARTHPPLAPHPRVRVRHVWPRQPGDGGQPKDGRRSCSLCRADRDVHLARMASRISRAHRCFAVPPTRIRGASAATFMLGVALFGSLILLPLYYQVVRAQSPLDVGLLLVPQGVGAALAMPLAGWLTATHGARVVLPAGVVVAAAGTLAYTQVGAQTPYWLLAAALLIVGLGIRSTIMPCMAAAFQGPSREQTAGATSALNVIQRVSGAVGTALL